MGPFHLDGQRATWRSQVGGMTAQDGMVRVSDSFIFIIYHKTPQNKNKNKDFYDKILPNTCLDENPMRFALCEQCPPEFRPEFCDVTKQ
jgi:hypothetical protein